LLGIQIEKQLMAVSCGKMSKDFTPKWLESFLSTAPNKKQTRNIN